jgi:acetyl esterase/lipase
LSTPEKGWPLVVFVYGGAWSSGSKDLYALVPTHIRAAGHAVAIVNYTLYPRVWLHAQG